MTMKYVDCEGEGDTSVLNLKTGPIPIINENEMLIKVQSVGINRADILQRQGKYPPPKGASKILGLEAAGYAVKEDGKIDQNDRVFALVNGGSYAEFVKVNKKHVIKIPKELSLAQAGGIAEAWLTAYLNLRTIDNGKHVMVYAGASGVGTAALQLINWFGGISHFTVSSEEKLQFCKKIGGKYGYNYNKLKEDEIIESIKKHTNGKMIDIVLDCIGPANAELNNKILNMDSIWVLYGLLSGAKINNFNMAYIVSKRISLIGSTIRSKNDNFKTKLIHDFEKEVMIGFHENKLVPVIDKIIDLDWSKDGVEKVKIAHKYMEDNKNKGKIVLNFI